MKQTKRQTVLLGAVDQRRLADLCKWQEMSASVVLRVAIFEHWERKQAERREKLDRAELATRQVARE